MKHTHRWSLEKKEYGLDRVKSSESRKGFLVLFELGPNDAMEMGCDISPSPKYFYMTDASGLTLK